MRFARGPCSFVKNSSDAALCKIQCAHLVFARISRGNDLFFKDEIKNFSRPLSTSGVPYRHPSVRMHRS